MVFCHMSIRVFMESKLASDHKTVAHHPSVSEAVWVGRELG